MIHPHIIHRTGSILKLSPTQVEKLQKDPRSILWINDGLYIGNHDKLCEMVELPTTGPGEWVIQLHWTQAVEVPASTGRVMEQYNGSKLE